MERSTISGWVGDSSVSLTSSWNSFMERSTISGSAPPQIAAILASITSPRTK
jgi:hypothetical protein